MNSAHYPRPPLRPKLAFNDRMFFRRTVVSALDFRRRPVDEEEADAKALELLKNSPYKRNCQRRIVPQGTAAAGAGIAQPDPAHWAIAGGGRKHPHVRLLATARHWTSTASIRSPRFLRTGQGQSWTDRVELSKAACDLELAREKRPLRSPFFPYLTRCE